MLICLLQLSRNMSLSADAGYESVNDNSGSIRLTFPTWDWNIVNWNVMPFPAQNSNFYKQISSILAKVDFFVMFTHKNLTG